MSITYAPTALRVPKGFEHLLEGLCTEVLRSQPADILLFAVEHFNKLITLREETGYDGYTPKIQLNTETTTENNTITNGEIIQDNMTSEVIHQQPHDANQIEEDTNIRQYEDTIGMDTVCS